MGGVRRDLEELKLQVDDLDKARDRRAGLELIERAQHRLNLINGRYRDAVITSKRLMQAVTASLSPREQLLRSASPANGKGRPTTSDTNASADDALMAATSDVTEGLRRTLQLMQQELDRSLISTELLQTQTATMQMTSDQYSTFSTLLTTSKALISSLERADMLDRLILLFAFIFFCLCCAWIVKRRVLDKGLRVAGAVGRVVAGGGSTADVVERAAEDVRDAISVLTTTATLFASSFLAARSPEPTREHTPAPQPTPTLEALLDTFDEQADADIAAPIEPRSEHPAEASIDDQLGHMAAGRGAVPQAAAGGGGVWAYENRTHEVEVSEAAQLELEQKVLEDALASLQAEHPQKRAEPPIEHAEFAAEGDVEDEDEDEDDDEEDDAEDLQSPASAGSPAEDLEELVVDAMDERAFDGIVAPVGLAFADEDAHAVHASLPTSESPPDSESDDELSPPPYISEEDAPARASEAEWEYDTLTRIYDVEPVLSDLLDSEPEHVWPEESDFEPVFAREHEPAENEGEMDAFLDAMDGIETFGAYGNSTEAESIDESSAATPFDDPSPPPSDEPEFHILPFEGEELHVWPVEADFFPTADKLAESEESGEDATTLDSLQGDAPSPTPPPTIEISFPPEPDVSSDDPEDIIGSLAATSATATAGSGAPTSDTILVTITDSLSADYESAETAAEPEPTSYEIPVETALPLDGQAPPPEPTAPPVDPIEPVDDPSEGLDDEERIFVPHQLRPATPDIDAQAALDENLVAPLDADEIEFEHPSEPVDHDDGAGPGVAVPESVAAPLVDAEEVTDASFADVKLSSSPAEEIASDLPDLLDIESPSAVDEAPEPSTSEPDVEAFGSPLNVPVEHASVAVEPEDFAPKELDHGTPSETDDAPPAQPEPELDADSSEPPAAEPTPLAPVDPGVDLDDDEYWARLDSPFVVEPVLEDAITFADLDEPQQSLADAGGEAGGEDAVFEEDTDFEATGKTVFEEMAEALEREGDYEDDSEGEYEHERDEL